MGDLSKNFSRAEFECKCGCGSAEVDPLLIETIQRIRDAAGTPLRVNSGVRCPSHNRRVGGVSNSQHLLGKAADITWTGLAEHLYSLIHALYRAGKLPHLGYAKLYSAKNFVHVDVRSPKSETIKLWKE